MFCLTHQERKVLLAVAVLILIGSLIRYFKTSVPANSNLIIYSAESISSSKKINPVSNKSSKMPAAPAARISNGVNINSASIQQLQEIKGIGEVTARRIAEYREQFGEFKVVEDLEEVKGIGEKKARVIGEYICFK
ncbi:MAG: ComEA family DNA-binding protein [Candidatus Omnitrophota bacterium]